MSVHPHREQHGSWEVWGSCHGPSCLAQTPLASQAWWPQTLPLAGIAQVVTGPPLSTQPACSAPHRADPSRLGRRADRCQPTPQDGAGLQHHIIPGTPQSSLRSRAYGVQPVQLVLQSQGQPPAPGSPVRLSGRRPRHRQPGQLPASHIRPRVLQVPHVQTKFADTPGPTWWQSA